MNTSAKGIICIVEDDDAVRASTRLLLEAMEFSVMEFANAESFPAGQAPPADCLILDDRLPGMSGMDLLESLRRKDVKTPVIIVAAEVQHLAGRAARARVVATLCKPLAAEALVHWLERIFSQKNAAAPSR